MLIARAGIFVLISLVFFFRGEWFGVGGPSLTLMIAPVSILMLGWLVMIGVVRNSVPVPSLSTGPTFYYMGVLLVSTLLSLIISYTYTPLALSFVVEVVMNGAMFYVFWLACRQGVIDTRIVVYMLIAACVLAVVVIGVMLLNVTAIRRINFLATSVNHLAHSFAIVAFVTLCALWKRAVSSSSAPAASMAARGAFATLFLYGVLGTALIMLLLTGTRSAWLGFIVAVGVVIGLRSPTRVVALAGLAAIAVTAGILALQARGVSVDAMIARYTADTLTEGAGTRFRSWGRALAAIDYTTFTIGKPWTYELFGEREAYPHNIYLSTALYAGLVPLLVLVVVTGMALLQRVRRWDEVAVKGAFIIALVYTMFSGNMTRVMTIFALLAVLEATRANENESLAKQGQGDGEALCPVK